MFERFTDRARKVMALANQEAMSLGHGYVGTEHILLGLIKEDSGVAKGKVKTLAVTDVHNCCGACTKSIKDAVKKVEGVTANTVKPRTK